MWKKKKVKAGVLLYAVTVAAIFSLLLQFYLNRQVAHYQDYALNKEKLVAFAMAKRTKDKVEQESGEQAFNLGQVSYQNKKTSLVTTVRTSKSQYEFLFPSVKIKEEKTDKKEEVATDSSEKVEGNRLYMKQDGKEIAMGKSKSDDFRKTDASGRGYQPMIYGLKSAQITEDNQLVRFRFQFQKGLEREFIYRVEKEKS